jgi:hypothetical protein
VASTGDNGAGWGGSHHEVAEVVALGRELERRRDLQWRRVGV